jgi:hypothetical protein
MTVEGKYVGEDEEQEAEHICRSQTINFQTKRFKRTNIRKRRRWDFATEKHR